MDKYKHMQKKIVARAFCDRDYGANHMQSMIGEEGSLQMYPFVYLEMEQGTR